MLARGSAAPCACLAAQRAHGGAGCFCRRYRTPVRPIAAVEYLERGADVMRGDAEEVEDVAERRVRWRGHERARARLSIVLHGARSTPICTTRASVRPPWRSRPRPAAHRARRRTWPRRRHGGRSREQSEKSAPLRSMDGGPPRCSASHDPVTAHPASLITQQLEAWGGRTPLCTAIVCKTGGHRSRTRLHSPCYPTTGNIRAPFL